MFLYAFLVLLPASALAKCDPVIFGLFFDALDANKDNEVNRTESDAFYNKLNKDGDDCLTLAETQAQAAAVAPELAGHEPQIYAKMDRDSNGCITNSDLDQVYLLMDTSKNDAVSRAEYKTAFRILCSPDAISSLIKGFGNNIG